MTRRTRPLSRWWRIVQLPKPVKEQVIERRVQELPLVDRDLFRMGGTRYEVVAIYDQPVGASCGVIRAEPLIGRSP